MKNRKVSDEISSFWVYYQKWLKENQVLFSRVCHNLPGKAIVLDFKEYTLRNYFPLHKKENAYFSSCSKGYLCSRVISADKDFDEKNLKSDRASVFEKFPDLPVELIQELLSGGVFQEIRFGLYFDSSMLYLFQFFWIIEHSRTLNLSQDESLHGINIGKWIHIEESEIPNHRDYFPKWLHPETMMDSFKSQILSDFYEKKFFPGHLPLFSHSSGDYQKLNQALLAKKNFFFLNGQKGTGRILFVLNYLRIHFSSDLNEFLSENIIFSSGSIRHYFILSLEKNRIINYSVELANIMQFTENHFFVLLIPELLHLERKSQDFLYDFSVFIHNSNQGVVFIFSSYDLSAIKDPEVLHPELQRMCLDNREIFPSYASLVSRSYGKVLLEELIEDYIFYDIIYDSEKKEKDNDYWLLFLENKNKKSHTNFQDLFYRNSIYKNENSSINIDISPNSGLRDYIAEAEKKAILFAYENIAKSQQEIADYLGISRGSLQHKLRKYKLRLEE